MWHSFCSGCWHLWRWKGYKYFSRDFSTHWDRDEIATISGRHFQMHFWSENAWISIKISQKFIPKGPAYDIPALVQIMVWYRPGDKPLSGPMMFSLRTHICVTWPWVIRFDQNSSTIMVHVVYLKGFLMHWWVMLFSYVILYFHSNWHGVYHTHGIVNFETARRYDLFCFLLLYHRFLVY